MKIKIDTPLVTVDWLKHHFNYENLIVLDCTIPKVTSKLKSTSDMQILGAVYFDIKNTFSDQNANFPNTVLNPKEFEKKAQELGINNDSIVVCYDNLGVYSSPRVWWNFKLMGFDNVAVLNGGFPKWKTKNYPTEPKQQHKLTKGNFVVKYSPTKIKYTDNVLSQLKDNHIIIADARSKGRFYGTEPEPRVDVKSGHIPNSKSFPYTSVLKEGVLKPKEELKLMFQKINPDYKEFIFTCGTGITASILALAAELSEFKKYAVYDGSWTEWGSSKNVPIEI
ncbi:sulfurtransferase [Polaribacter sp. WD7]|uniref:sulfurtransferase n=1 Tax=Polaribacter sp. WD7 TaxID=2269061 RepID=UPI000DF3DC28|nr:sulfurtransferase [Polaribacter sp. WD7]RCS26890.1 sulfurtransferase [Polaribacter sp. WD7]